MMAMMEKWQTPFTPNVLAIYLLMRVMEKADPIAVVHDRTVKRYEAWTEFLSKRKNLQHLVANTSVHSYTVLPVKGTADTVTNIKKSAKRKGLLLGEGYGAFKPLTFRIANFPAIADREIATLKQFLKAF
jgi:phosphoserine aminotransferase